MVDDRAADRRGMACHHPSGGGYIMGDQLSLGDIIANLPTYEVTDSEIIIHAIRHAARDPSGMPGSV
jgi:hypothetical protein